MPLHSYVPDGLTAIIPFIGGRQQEPTQSADQLWPHDLPRRLESFKSLSLIPGQRKRLPGAMKASPNPGSIMALDEIPAAFKTGGFLQSNSSSPLKHPLMPSNEAMKRGGKIQTGAAGGGSALGRTHCLGENISYASSSRAKARRELVPATEPGAGAQLQLTSPRDASLSHGPDPCNKRRIGSAGVHRTPGWPNAILSPEGAVGATDGVQNRRTQGWGQAAMEQFDGDQEIDR